MGAVIAECGSRVSSSVGAAEGALLDLAQSFGETKRKRRSSSAGTGDDMPEKAHELKKRRSSFADDSLMRIVADPMLAVSAAMCMFGCMLSSRMTGVSASNDIREAALAILWVFTNALFVSTGHILSKLSFTRFSGNAVLDRVMNAATNWECSTFRSALETLSYLISIFIAYSATSSILHTGIVGAFSGILICSLTEAFERRRKHGTAKHHTWKRRHALFVIASACATAGAVVVVLSSSKDPLLSVLAVFSLLLFGFFLRRSRVKPLDIFYAYVILGALGWGASIMESIISCDISLETAPESNPRIFPDVAFAVLACGAVSLARIGCLKFILRRMARWLLTGRKEKKGWTDREYEEKIAKCSTSMFKCGYMAIASTWGWGLLYGAPWAPPS